MARPAVGRAPRAVIAAGGTGGHFYPGLVLAQTLRGRGWQPLLLVRRDDPARATLEREGLPFVELDLFGWPRALSPAVLRFPARLLGSFAVSRRLIADFQPKVVVGMGGYLSAPPIAAAALRGVPRLAHEANALLGLANRFCALAGGQVLWGLPSGVKGVVTGTPIRPALWTRGDRDAARRRFNLEPGRATVLIFGGSQGARALNQRLPALLAEAAPQAQFLHLAGAAGATEATASYAAAGAAALVLPYLDDMASAYAAADLVVCRAGASTIAELAAQRKPAILVPFPSAAAGHQEINARLLERAGATAVVLESELSKAAELCRDLLSSDARRSSMERAYDGLGLPPPAECAARIADAVERAALSP